MKLMDALYGGNIYPSEQVLSRDPEYQKAIKDMDTLMMEFEKKLSKEQYSKVDRLCDLLADSSDIQNKEFFSYGVAFGILLIQETMEVFQTHTRKSPEK